MIGYYIKAVLGAFDGKQLILGFLVGFLAGIRFVGVVATELKARIRSLNAAGRGGRTKSIGTTSR